MDVLAWFLTVPHDSSLFLTVAPGKRMEMFGSAATWELGCRVEVVQGQSFTGPAGMEEETW